MDLDIYALINRVTLELLPCPKDATTVTCKCVVKLKYNIMDLLFTTRLAWFLLDF